jgi:hypothetical protein
MWNELDVEPLDIEGMNVRISVRYRLKRHAEAAGKAMLRTQAKP